MENKPVTLFDRIFYIVACLISAHLLFMQLHTKSTAAKSHCLSS